MPHPTRLTTRLAARLGAALGALVLASAVLAPAPTLASADAPADAPATDAPAADAARAGAWKCGGWKRTGSSSGSRWCVKFSRITPIVKQDGQDLLHNSWKTRKKMHCSLSRGTTVEFHASGTIEAEAGVIFAKAKTSVTAGASRSTTTTSTTGAEFWVGGGKWAYCARGHAAFRIAGTTRKEVCGEGGCRYFSGTSFKTLLPSSPFFDIGPGKNIDWKRYLPDA